MIKWTENYNVHKAIIDNVIVLVVAYDSKGGYRVSASGAYTVRLKNNSENLDDGKARAIALGKKLLQKALDRLNEN